MPFIPHTPAESAEMLAAVGVNSMDELFDVIPAHLRLSKLEIPDGISEYAVSQRLGVMAARNPATLKYFIGGGFYDHTIPAAVDALSSRGEFFTAYTPYQPEVSQGTLQAIFEYQSMICRLTGMDVANASLYDGGSALAEAVILAANATKRKEVIVAESLNPVYQQQLRTLTCNLGITLKTLPITTGTPLDPDKLRSLLSEQSAAVVVQTPDFFGSISDLTAISELTQAQGALLIASVYPLALGVLKQPADMGVDIVTGEGQSLGIPLSSGGPYLGFMALRKALVRRMPGRVVGITKDRHGQRCYTLTLQAREQHIRRERATSNICTNQALCALRATIYLALTGKKGLLEVAETCRTKALYAQQQLSSVKGVRMINTTPIFNEFVVELPFNAVDFVRNTLKSNMVAGLPLSLYFKDMDSLLLVAVTEKRTQDEIDQLAASVAAYL